MISSTPCLVPTEPEASVFTFDCFYKPLILKNFPTSEPLEKLQTLVQSSKALIQRKLRSRLIQTVVIVSAAMGLPACAAPKQAPDAVTQFLTQRGLLDANGNVGSGGGLFDSVRERASDLVVNAMNFLGVPYRYGGTSEDTGFDCSGFTRHVFESSLGRLLPRRSEDQAAASGMMSIGQEDLKPGDLVFFNTMRKAFSHVGIYVGDGKFIHSPRTGSTVRVEDMRQAYWTNRFNGARRAPELNAGQVGSAAAVANLTATQSP